jgi:hypothetical protein
MPLMAAKTESGLLAVINAVGRYSSDQAVWLSFSGESVVQLRPD